MEVFYKKFMGQERIKKTIFKKKGYSTTSPLSQHGKQGLSWPPSNYFTGPVAVKWYKQEQRTCIVIRLARVAIRLRRNKETNA